MKLIVRKSTLHDCCELTPKLKEAHRIEVRRMANQTPEEALAYSYLMSVKCFTVCSRVELDINPFQKGDMILVDENPIFMFGVVPDDNSTDRGVVWGLGSDEVELSSNDFIRISRAQKDQIIQEFPVCYNFIDAEYKQGIRWLKFLGATITSDPINMGHENAPFHYFEFRRS